MEMTFEDTFQPAYKGKLFVVNPAKIRYSFDIDVDPMTPEGKGMVEKVKKLWTARMKALRSAKEKEYGAAINDTDRNLYKSASKLKSMPEAEKWLTEQAKGANVMIQNAIKTFESIFAKEAESIYAEAAKEIDKKYKSSIGKMKRKAVLKIVGHVLIIVAAGAVAIIAAAAGIAATGATMGAGAVTIGAVAPVILAALATVAKSGFSIYKAIDKEWPSYEKSLATLEEKLKALITAVEYENRKQQNMDLRGKLGPKEKLKLLLTNVKGKRGDVEAAIKNCYAYRGRLRQKVEAMAQEVTAMQAKIDDLKTAAKANPKLSKEADGQVKKQIELLHKIDKARAYLTKLDPVVVQAKTVLGKDLQDVGKLKGLLGVVQTLLADDSVRLALAEAKPVIAGVQKIGKAVAKAA